jgi:flagellar hook assembly protein FlgD
LQRFLSTATIVGLLIATAAAFAITERLKLTKSPITGTHVTKTFSPTCSCARGKAKISVKLRRGDTVNVIVDDSHRRPVRTLVAGDRVPRGRTVFTWNGATDAGVRAPDGVYHVQIHLDAQHRTILLPNAIVLDTTPPEVLDATPNRTQFSPDGDHQADSVTIRYTLSEPAHVLVFFDGTRIVRSHLHKTSGAFSWAGRFDGKRLPPGMYTLTVGAVDLAGNTTPVARQARVRVELRYITLASHRITGVTAGRPFDIGVSTDARRYSWRLGARHGVAHGPVLKLRAPAKPGRYRLTVTERGHSDHAVVVAR